MGSLRLLKEQDGPLVTHPDVCPHQKGTGALLENSGQRPSCNPLDLPWWIPVIETLSDSPFSTGYGFKSCHLASSMQDYIARVYFPRRPFDIPTLRRDLNAGFDHAESHLFADGSLSGPKSTEPGQCSSRCTIPGDTTGRLSPICVSPPAATIYSA